MITQETTAFLSRNFLLSTAILSFAAISSSAPINDSYRESLLYRQLNRDCKRECSNQNSAQLKSEKNAEVSTEISAHEILVGLKSDGFPIATIASMAGVERKTIYAWLDGAILKQENEARIYELHSLLNHGKVASYRNLYRYINREIEGITLASALSEDTLDHSQITKLLDRLWPLAKKTERSLAFNDSPSSEGNPIIDESLEV